MLPITYRKITSADVDSVTAFAIEGLRPERFPMVFCPRKTRAAVEHFAGSAGDFQCAAFDGSRVVGAIAAMVSESPFFERCDAHVWLLYAKVPGVGRELVNRMLAWAKGHPMVRRVVWAQNSDADPRTKALAKRCADRAGLAVEEVTMQVFYKE